MNSTVSQCSLYIDYNQAAAVADLSDPWTYKIASHCNVSAELKQNYSCLHLYRSHMYIAVCMLCAHVPTVSGLYKLILAGNSVDSHSTLMFTTRDNTFMQNAVLSWQQEIL